MKTVRSIAFTVAAASALTLGAARAQDSAKKPEAKPEARPGATQPHRGMHGMHARQQGMSDMRKQQMGEMRGCPEHEPRGAGEPAEHDHS